MAHKFIQQIADALIEKIKTVPRSEGRTFDVGIDFAGHKINAKYFQGTFERDGSYDILPGMIVTIDDTWYAYRWANVTGEVEHIVSRSQEYLNLQKECEKYLDLLLKNEEMW